MISLAQKPLRRIQGISPIIVTNIHLASTDILLSIGVLSFSRA
jgi:hypothetical protein